MRIPELCMNIMLYYYFTPIFPRKDEKSMLTEIRPYSARWCLITKPEDHNILKRSPDAANNVYTWDSGRITTVSSQDLNSQVNLQTLDLINTLCRQKRPKLLAWASIQDAICFFRLLRCDSYISPNRYSNYKPLWHSSLKFQTWQYQTTITCRQVLKSIPKSWYFPIFIRLHYIPWWPFHF